MKTLISFFLLLPALAVSAQSNTTQELHKKYDDAFYLFFYENTLQMLNQQNSEEFSRLINDIDKMKFLRIDKKKYSISREDVKSLMKKYQGEEFEELMSMREEGADIKVYIKEKDKITYGLVMLINDEEALAVLDIKGSVPLNDLVNLYNQVKLVNK